MLTSSLSAMDDATENLLDIDAGGEYDEGGDHSVGSVETYGLTDPNAHENAEMPIPYADEELPIVSEVSLQMGKEGHRTKMDPNRLGAYLDKWHNKRPSFEDEFGLLQALLNDDYEGVSGRIPSAAVGKCRYGMDRVTALIIASVVCSSRITVALLNAGFDPNERDGCGRLPLLVAAERGRSECVEVLLRGGADPKAIFTDSGAYRESLAVEDEVWYKNEDEFMKKNDFTMPKLEDHGRTALHFATEANSFECVDFLLKAKASADTKDHRGITPLMLAGERVEPGDSEALGQYEKIVRALIDERADANSNHEVTGKSPLLRATQFGCNGTLRLLLERGADPNWSSVLFAENTALHIAADIAAVSAFPHPSAISTLLSHGADICAENEEEETALEAILRKVSYPAKFFYKVLDDQVTLKGDMCDKNCKVRVNFRAMRPVDEDGQVKVLHELLEGENISKWMRYEIFRHPYPKSFVSAKWNGLRYFFYFYVSAYVVHVLSLSFFATHYHSNRINIFGRDWKWDVMQSGVPISRIFVVMTAILVLINVSVMCYVFPRRFPFRIEMLRNVIGSVLSIFVSILTVYDGYIVRDSVSERLVNFASGEDATWTADAAIDLTSPENVSPKISIGSEAGTIVATDWFYMPEVQSVVLHCTAIAVFLAWLELMLLVGRFPWAADALLFTAVVKNVLRVLVTYGFMIVGFAFVFFLEFRSADNHAFGDPWKSLVKTIVMMTGEFDYMDIFAEEGEGRMVSVNKGMPWFSRAIFLCFVVLASIALMNLMLGLSVSDTQDLAAESSERQLMKLAECVVHWEFVVCALEKLFWRFRSLKGWLTSCRTVPADLCFPLSLKKSIFPRDIMKCLSTIAVRNYAEGRKGRSPGAIYCPYPAKSHAPATPGNVSLRPEFPRVPPETRDALESIRRDLEEMKELRREVVEIKELLDNHFNGRQFPHGLSRLPPMVGRRKVNQIERRSFKSKRGDLASSKVWVE